MDEEMQLLAAIRANLKDDTVRLAYADWLDERGRSGKAEYIRAQLLKRDYSRTAAEAFEVAPHGLRAQWSRGFARAVYGNLEELVLHRSFFRAQPAVEYLVVLDRCPRRYRKAYRWECDQFWTGAKQHSLPTLVCKLMPSMEAPSFSAALDLLTVPLLAKLYSDASNCELSPLSPLS